MHLLYIHICVFIYSSLRGEVRVGSQGRTLEAGTEVEDPEECCFMACSFDFLSLLIPARIPV